MRTYREGVTTWEGKGGVGAYPKISIQKRTLIATRTWRVEGEWREREARGTVVAGGARALKQVAAGEGQKHLEEQTLAHLELVGGRLARRAVGRALARVEAVRGDARAAERRRAEQQDEHGDEARDLHHEEDVLRLLAGGGGGDALGLHELGVEQVERRHLGDGRDRPRPRELHERRAKERWEKRWEERDGKER